MKYTELHDVLTNQIEKIASEGMTPEQMKSERYKAEILVKLAKQTIKNGNLILQAEKLDSAGLIPNSKIKDLV